MKKIKIFSLLSILLAVFSLVSVIGKAEGKYTLTAGSSEGTGCTVEGNVITASSTRAFATLSFADTAVANGIVSFKYAAGAGFENFDITALGKDADGGALSVLVGVEVPNGWNSKKEGNYSGFVIVNVDISSYLDDKPFVTYNALEIKVRCQSGTTLEILDFAATSDGVHGFSTEGESTGPVLPEVKDFESCEITSSGATVDGNVYTLEGESASIYATFDNVVADYKYISIKYKLSDGVDFETYVYAVDTNGSDTSFIVAGGISGAWNATKENSIGYVIATINASSYLGGASTYCYNKIKLSVTGAVGSTIEIAGVELTKDGLHHLASYDPETPTTYAEITSSKSNLISVNAEGDQVITYDSTTKPGWTTFDIAVNNHNPEQKIFEFVYSSNQDIVMCFQINGKYEGHLSYDAGENKVATLDFSNTEKYKMGPNFTVEIYFDATDAVFGEEAKVITVHSYGFKSPDPLPEGFIVKDPVGVSSTVKYNEAGYWDVTYEAGAWRNVTVNFLNHEENLDALLVDLDVTALTNIGFRLYYKDAEGVEHYKDVRNHGAGEGVFAIGGRQTVVAYMGAFGLEGLELTKVELWLDVPNEHTTNSGAQAFKLYSVNIVDSTTLDAEELAFTVPNVEVTYSGEEPTVAVECDVEGLTFKQQHLVEGKWYDGIPTNGGTYQIRTTFMGSVDYLWKVVESTLIINKADQENNEANISIDQETGVITIAEGVEASFTEDFTGDRIANGDVIPFDVNVFFRIPGNSNYNVSEVLHKSITRNLAQQIAYEVELIEEKIAGYEEDSRIQKLVNPLIEKIKGAQDKSDIEIYLEEFNEDELSSLKETIDAERALTKAQNEAKSSIAALILGYEEEDSIKAIVNPIIAKIDAAKTPAEVEAAVAELNVEVLNEAIEVVIAARNLKNEKDSQIEFINDYVGEFASQINVQAYIDRINQATSIDEVQEIADEACDFIDDQKDIIALQPTKDDAIEELEAIDLTAYRDAEKAVVEGHINDAKTAINAATTLAGVESALETAKTAIALVKTDANLDAEELDAAKNAAYDDIDEAADPSDYQTEEQTELVNIINKAKADINEATTIAQVESLLNAALEDIDALWTTQDYIDKAAKDLADAKSAAKAELDTYLDKANYREAQHADIDAAIAAGKAAIDGAGSTDVVTSAMNDAKAALDAIKTDAELDAEEAEAAAKALAAAKEAAIAAVVAEIGSYNIDKTEYVNAINAATSTDAVQTALTNAKSDIATKKAAIDEANKPAPQPTPEPQPQPTPEPSKKGCKGSLVASIFGMVALLGACLTFKRKKD